MGYPPWRAIAPKTEGTQMVKMYCEYCGQTSPDDERGGCRACGGPRPRAGGAAERFFNHPMMVYGSPAVLSSSAVCQVYSSTIQFPAPEPGIIWR